MELHINHILHSHSPFKPLGTMHVSSWSRRTKMNITYQMCEVSLSLNFECHVGSVFIKYLPWYVVFKLSFLFSYTQVIIIQTMQCNAMYDFFLAKYPISVVFWQRISPNLLRILTWIYFAEQSRHQDWFLKIVEHHWNTLWRSSVSWSNT